MFFLQTPLHLAAITKQPRALDSLLRARADVRSRDRHGNTAVHIVSAHGDAVCLRVLLNYSETKAVLNEQNYQGEEGIGGFQRGRQFPFVIKHWLIIQRVWDFFLRATV